MSNDMHIDRLKELILDEEKIVTYISLSKDLCIHVNEAKSLLSRVTTQIREAEPKIVINVSYVISGLLDNNSACTTVCSEDDIESLRTTLKIIFYEHVYCVSRGLRGADNVALTAINKLEDFPLCTGLIKTNLCVKRTGDEIRNLKSSSNHVVSVELKSKLKDIPKKCSSEKLKESRSSDQLTVVEVKSEPMKSNTQSPKKDISVNNNKGNINNNGTKSARGIAGFFNKINDDNSKTKTTKIKQENENNEVEVKLEKKIKVKTHSSGLIFDQIKKEEPDKKSKELANNNVSLKRIKKNSKVDTKRKRVLHVSDSESETETNDPFADDDKMVVDHESEDEIPPTPTVNTVKITSGIINPKKRRKIVNKTYTDEDGYILTKKEEVYESCSDNEEEIKANIKQEKESVPQVAQVKTESPQKANGKSRKKKISPPQKGKQQTLTSFFKKLE